MTNAEAKAILEGNAVPTFPPKVRWSDWVDAMTMAAEALEKQSKLAEAIHRIEALDSADYGWIGSYAVHKGARMMKKDVLDILNDLIEEE